MDTHGKLIPLKQVLGNNWIKSVLNAVNNITHIYSVAQVASINDVYFHTSLWHFTFNCVQSLALWRYRVLISARKLATSADILVVNLYTHPGKCQGN
jgi:hypothetical protein